MLHNANLLLLFYLQILLISNYPPQIPTNVISVTTIAIIDT